MLLKFCCFAGSTTGSVMLIFCDIFWRSVLLEYSDWIRLYVLGHCLGCSLWPGTQWNPPWKLSSSVGLCPFVVIDPTNLGAATELLIKALCLSILNLSLTQNICLYTNANKASLSDIMWHASLQLTNKRYFLSVYFISLSDIMWHASLQLTNKRYLTTLFRTVHTKLARSQAKKGTLGNISRYRLTKDKRAWKH